MKRILRLFALAFLAGALAALAFRSARHQPYAEEAPPTMMHEPAAHTAEAVKTVNSICAICGMAVDPTIPPADYQGKKVGFGCRMCPPKFAADPERYGPSALLNVEAD